MTCPADLLTRYAVRLDLACVAPHRYRSDTELLALLDDHGLDITQDGRGYRWGRGGVLSSRLFATLSGAALAALWVAAPRVQPCVRARTYYAVAPWIAFFLEQHGEILRHTRAGVSVWAACGDDGEPSNDNPLLAHVYEQGLQRYGAAH